MKPPLKRGIRTITEQNKMQWTFLVPLYDLLCLILVLSLSKYGYCPLFFLCASVVKNDVPQIAQMTEIRTRTDGTRMTLIGRIRTRIRTEYENVSMVSSCSLLFLCFYVVNCSLFLCVCFAPLRLIASLFFSASSSRLCGSTPLTTTQFYASFQVVIRVVP
jgi:hypothetical protein